MRPAHNEALRESFEAFDITRGYNEAFIERVRAKRRREVEAIAEQSVVTAETPIGLTPWQRKLRAIADDEREKILAAKAAKERLRQIAIEKIQAMKERHQSGEDAKIPARDIVKAIAAANGVKFGDIVGPRRNTSLVKIRFEAIRQVADLRSDLSLPALGRVFNRDHTSILHALKKTAKDGDHWRANRASA